MLQYKRLQVRRIWLRTLFEVVCLIMAIVVCSALIITEYEGVFNQRRQKHMTNSTDQYADLMSGLFDAELFENTDHQRRDYIKEKLAAEMDGCFIAGDTVNAGAAYEVLDDECVLFSKSSYYSSELSPEQEYALKRSVKGVMQSGAEKDFYYTFLPLKDKNGKVYAVAAATTSYRSALDYDSLVTRRLTIIGIVSATAIIVYYIGSALFAQRKKLKGEIVAE